MLNLGETNNFIRKLTDGSIYWTDAMLRCGEFLGFFFSQELTQTPVREPAEQDVPGLLHAHLRLRCHLRRRVRLPPPVEDVIGRRPLPARVPALRARLQPLQSAGLHPHDHRGEQSSLLIFPGPLEKSMCYYLA
jgi:hypothetical protein